MQSTINGFKYEIKPWAFLQGSDLHESKLTFADLHDANLAGSDISDSFARFANFERAKMQQCNFNGSDMRNVKMRSAEVAGANMRYTNLAFADMRDADLTGVNFECADVHDADLTGATIRDANFNRACIDGVKGLMSLYIPSLHVNGVTLYAVKHPQTVWVMIGANYFNIMSVYTGAEFDGVNTPLLRQILPIIADWGRGQ
jgi:uncharacterized protein YjbI with pentapeptide repeats